MEGEGVRAESAELCQCDAGQEQLTIFACPGATFVENVAVAGLFGMLSYVAQYSYARSGPGIDY